MCSLILSPLFVTGVVDTGGKLAGGRSIADTSGNFAAGRGIVDTGGKDLREFSKKFLTVIMEYSGAGGNWFIKKTRSKKSRDTVPLILECCLL